MANIEMLLLFLFPPSKALKVMIPQMKSFGLKQRTNHRSGNRELKNPYFDTILVSQVCKTGSNDKTLHRDDNGIGKGY